MIVSSYLDKPQKVVLSLEDAPWFERLEDRRAIGDARAQRGPRGPVPHPGQNGWPSRASGDGAGSDRGVADTVRRPIDVVPDGRRVEQVAGGTLPRQHPVELALTTPDHAIPGSVKAIVKIYPSSFSQVVEGLDSIFQRPTAASSRPHR